MRRKNIILLLVLLGAALVILALSTTAEAKVMPLSSIELLGKRLYFDKALSLNGNQSCATCHAPEFGYVGGKGFINMHGAVYPGSVPTLFGDRKPPTAAYGGESPIFHFDPVEGLWIGGMFWDGRATGWVLGDPLAEQAKGPFLNPVEQALPDAHALCELVAMSNYARLYKQVWGPIACDTPTAVEMVYDNIGLSISAYEKSYEVNPFASKFDLFYDKATAKGLDVAAINMVNWKQYLRLGLSSDEVYGLALFNDEEKGMCALCHTLDEGASGYPLFTDFSYDNLGIPSNPENPYLLAHPGWWDPGLGGFLKAAGYSADVYEPEYGKFKVPTLRNVDQREGSTVKAYGHNGYFKSLKEIVHFYNTRDVEMWPAPEYAETINVDELGNLGLTPAEEDAIVLFMTTLSDKIKP